MWMFGATNTFMPTIMTAQVQGFEIRARTHKIHRSRFFFFNQHFVVGRFLFYFSFLLCVSCFFFPLIFWSIINACDWPYKREKKSGSKTPLNIIINVQVFVCQTCARTHLKGQIWAQWWPMKMIVKLNFMTTCLTILFSTHAAYLFANSKRKFSWVLWHSHATIKSFVLPLNSFIDWRPCK